MGRGNTNMRDRTITKLFYVRVKGKTLSYPVDSVVDSGSTHTFIPQRILRRLLRRSTIASLPSEDFQMMGMSTLPTVRIDNMEISKSKAGPYFNVPLYAVYDVKAGPRSKINHLPRLRDEGIMGMDLINI